MKTLVLYLFALSLFLANAQYNVQVTKILTEKVASDGFLIFETSGLNMPLRMKSRPNLNQFQLTLKNEADNSQSNFYCFVYQFEHTYTSPAKIGCRIRGLTPGKYSVAPLASEITFNANRYRVTLLPFNIAGTFEVTEGKEEYFYEYDENDEDFEYPDDIEDIDFDLFEPAGGPLDIYFDDITVQCYQANYKLRCSLDARMFPKKRTQTYNVYIKDSLGNKKKNPFVLPVNLYFRFY